MSREGLLARYGHRRWCRELVWLADVLPGRQEILSLVEGLHAAHLAEVNALHGRLAQAEQRVRAAETRAAAAQAYLARVIEPPDADTGSACRKVRLRIRSEAEAFADAVTRDTGAGPFIVQHCRACPRQPLTGHRFLHITHADPAKRGRHGGGVSRPVNGVPIRQRLTLGQVADLAARTDASG